MIEIAERRRAKSDLADFDLRHGEWSDLESWRGMLAEREDPRHRQPFSGPFARSVADRRPSRLPIAPRSAGDQGSEGAEPAGHDFSEHD